MTITTTGPHILPATATACRRAADRRIAKAERLLAEAIEQLMRAREELRAADEAMIVRDQVTRAILSLTKAEGEVKRA